MSGRSSQAKGRWGEIELSGILREHGYPDARPGEPLSYGESPFLWSLERGREFVGFLFSALGECVSPLHVVLWEAVQRFGTIGFVPLTHPCTGLDFISRVFLIGFPLLTLTIIALIK